MTVRTVINSTDPPFVWVDVVGRWALRVFGTLAPEAGAAEALAAC